MRCPSSPGQGGAFESREFPLEFLAEDHVRPFAIAFMVSADVEPCSLMYRSIAMPTV